ncbi:MAG: hypothetical protein QM610_05850 [Chitinophagaceae bacterium]
MTTLTKEQIDQLFQFCQRHSVRYYDVQSELVDHLATAIESQMNENSNIPFDEAVHNVYKAFGATGFGKYLSEKEKQVQRKLSKERRKILLTFFTPPKVILTLAALALMLYPYITQDFILIKRLAIALCVIDLATIAIVGISTFWKRRKTKKDFRLFILERGNPVVFIGTFINFATVNIQLLNLTKSSENFNFWMSLALVLINFMAVLVINASAQQYKKICKYALHNYPEAFL